MSNFKSWNSYAKFAMHIRKQSRFIRNSENEEFLRETARTAKSRIEKIPMGFILWRAQLGHDWRPSYQDEQNFAEIPDAYPSERMKPNKHSAKEGRANPKGIPVLYLSTHSHTAMCEVRPWLGSLISCAQFKTTRSLNVVSLPSNYEDRFNYIFSAPDLSKWEETVWGDIGRGFSEPTTSSDSTADYAPTQVIAELFRSEGYDGIAYKSKFGDDGYNIALFDLEDAELISCCLYDVSTLQFSFKQFDNPYWIDEHGRKNRMSIEVIGPAKSSGDSDQ